MYIVGLVGALYEKIIIRIFDKFSRVILVVSLSIFLLTYRLEQFYIVRELCFLVFLICFLHRFEFKNIFLEFVGRMSMEVYLIHGLIIKAVRYYISEQSGLFELTLMSVLTILAAYLLKSLFDRFFSLLKRQ